MLSVLSFLLVKPMLSTVEYYIHHKKKMWNIDTSTHAEWTSNFFVYPYVFIAKFDRPAAKKSHEFINEAWQIFSLLRPIITRRSSTSSQGLLAETIAHHPNFFPVRPRGFGLVSPFIEAVEGQHHAYIEISNLGSTKYVIFEKLSDRFEEKREALSQYKHWKSRLVYGGPIIERPMIIEEIQFHVRAPTFVVFGCNLFWEVMTPRIIQALIVDKVDNKTSVSVLITEACNLLVLKYVSPHLTPSELYDMCNFKQPFSLKFSLLAHIVFAKPSDIPFYRSLLARYQLKPFYLPSSPEEKIFMQNFSFTQPSRNRSPSPKRSLSRSISSSLSPYAHDFLTPQKHQSLMLMDSEFYENKQPYSDSNTSSRKEESEIDISPFFSAGKNRPSSREK